MGEIININCGGEIMQNDGVEELIEISEQLLTDARMCIESGNAMSVPIAQLSTLGAGVASLIPELNTVTQTTTISTDGLFRLANAGVNDALKMAKNGNAWGAFKTAGGGSKFAQLQAVGPLTMTTKAAAAFNPATMMMAVALFSIEQELGNIEEMQKQILSFLEIEKESEIEADVETLMSIVRKFKANWTNEQFVDSNHKMVCDIQRTARKNMNTYQKKVADEIAKKQLLVSQTNVRQAFADLEKKFKYYRLSLYTFSLASLMEIMLSGNFREEYIVGVQDEIRVMMDTYRLLFGQSSEYLEKLSGHSIETNVMSGIGTAGKEAGRLIGKIPLANKASVDEFLQDGGDQLKMSAEDIKKEAVRSFATLGNPGTGAFLNKMDDMIRIYNRTNQICFDDKNIYLIGG